MFQIYEKKVKFFSRQCFKNCELQFINNRTCNRKTTSRDSTWSWSKRNSWWRQGTSRTNLLFQNRKSTE